MAEEDAVGINLSLSTKRPLVIRKFAIEHVQICVSWERFKGGCWRKLEAILVII